MIKSGFQAGIGYLLSGPYDEDHPQYNWAIPVEPDNGIYWCIDCYIIDEFENRLPGAEVSVPVIVDRGESVGMINELDQLFELDYGRSMTFRFFDTAQVILKREDDSEFSLDVIRVDWHFQGNGYGSMALKEVTDFANEHELTIWLTVEPIDNKRLGIRALFKWYERHGFERKGKFPKLVRYPNGN